jgi:hypothetical protein
MIFANAAYYAALLDTTVTANKSGLKIQYSKVMLF